MFPEATPTVNVSESEAKVAEDNPTASAKEKQVEERVPTPPITEEVVPEVNVSVPDPPAPQVEVENPEAATTNTTEANDVVMAEDTVDPAPNTVPEANEDNDAPATDVQPDASVDATAPVPPPRPHTIEHAFYQGELVPVKWSILVPPPAPGPQFDYHVEHRP